MSVERDEHNNDTYMENTMSVIKISGVSQTKFFNLTKEALSTALGSNITRKDVVTTFISNLFRLENKHAIPTLFDKNEESSPVNNDESNAFEILSKKAFFLYDSLGQVKLAQLAIKYKVHGYNSHNKVSISQGLINEESGLIEDVYPEYSGYQSERSNSKEISDQEAAENLQSAINHAFELAKWINTVKHVLEPNDLKSEGWTVRIKGLGLNCKDDPREIIQSVKSRTNPFDEIERQYIELILLQLVGTNIDSGYTHDDVIHAIKSLEPIFGQKFKPLLTNI